MDNFQFWTNWGDGLSDKDFANAFTALGVLAARSKTGPVPPSGSFVDPASIILENTVYESLKGIASSYSDPVKVPLMLLWRFPSPGHKIGVGLQEYNLANLNPSNLANTWQQVAATLAFKWEQATAAQPYEPKMPILRLQIIGFPKDAQIRPWYQMVLESDPQNKSAFVDFKTTYPEIHMKWPLRLGYLPGNSAENILRDTIIKWPSSGNTNLFEIGRWNDNCDFLVFDGTTAQLLSQLTSLRVSMKCNLFIIRGFTEDGYAEFYQNLLDISVSCRSNGFLFLKKDNVTDHAFSEMLNCAVEELSHNLHMDSALSKACILSFYDMNADPLILLSRSLANFRLEHQVKQTMKKILMMPPIAKMEVTGHTLARLNIPNAPTLTKNVSELKRLIGKKGFGFVNYQQEGTGATGLTELHKAMAEAPLPEEVHNARRERYISTRTYQKKEEQYIEEKRALLAGFLTKAIVWIGPPEEGAVQNPTPFPVEKLPPQTEAWGLTVVLSEPTHIRGPIIRKILLPQDGRSTECEFIFTPKEAVPFEGRIAILHRGRIIQTAVLKMPVVKDISKMPASDQIRIEDIIHVRNNLGDLDKRQQFDLAFITNHTADHRPYLTAIAKDSAWLVNLEACQPITEEINTALSKVALSVEDYKDGFDSVKGKELLKSLVFSGCELYSAIVEEQLEQQENMAEIIQKDYLQIVSTKNDIVIPFEFIYDYEVPDEDAEFCKKWKQVLKDGDCGENCAKHDRRTICPLGFWGLRKVIERHDVTPKLAKDNQENFLQSETTSKRAELLVAEPGLFAASDRVEKPELKAVENTFKKAFGTPPLTASDWGAWETQVIKNKPHLIIALTHTNGTGSKATLEIGSKSIKSIQVRPSHVRPDKAADYPLVALLGCDTSGSAVEYSSYIQQFRRKGAAIVIGTIATVFGGHAAQVANMIIEGFTAKDIKAERLGEILREMKRKAVLDGLVMALCVVAFGDADWKLTKK
jgi:hypothetical protein